MKKEVTPIAKIARPKLSGIFRRDRLFRLLDRGIRKPVVWVSAPAGFGKTTLVASYLDSRKLPCLWYQLDEGDGDIASFFYYMGLAAKKAAPHYKRPLPLLTPEYALGIPTFTRHFFENLCGRLKSPAVIVFDNYQELPEESSFHEMMQHGLSSIPSGINVIIMSRADPPPIFTGMQAGNKIHAINGNELKLTREESKGLIKLQGIDRLKHNLSEWMHEKTQGWAAGVVLLTRAISMEDIDPKAFEKLSLEKVFDYFANELLDHADASVQDFLLKTAFVPGLTVHIAAELTGNKAAGQILSDLNRRNFFTEKRQQKDLTYQYHSLFREFLLVRAKKTLSSQTIARIQGKAAKLLESSGQAEDAAEIYRESNDWQGLTALILSHAQLLIMQGRSSTLERWISAVPDTISATDPWLLYWHGNCRVLSAPPKARPFFENSFELFKQLNDRTGLFMSWAGIVDSYIHEWDTLVPLIKWIRKLKRLLKEERGFPTREVEVAVSVRMFNALYMIQPSDRDIPLWEQKLAGFMKDSEDMNQRMLMASALLMYYAWRGDLDKMANLGAELNVRGRTQESLLSIHLYWSVMDAVYHWYTADFATSLNRVRDALEISKKYGALVWDTRLAMQGVYASLGMGDLTAARAYLDDMAVKLNTRQRLDAAQYYYGESYYYTVSGDLSKAENFAEKALSFAEESGPAFPIALTSTGLAQVFFLRQKYRQAEMSVAKATLYGRQMGSLSVEMRCFILKAQLSFARGSERQAVQALRRGFAIGREKGYWNMDWWLPAVMSKLCAKALEHNVEVEYVRELIRMRKLSPPVLSDTGKFPSSPYAKGGMTGYSTKEWIWTEKWPWPVKIYTLGRFSVIKDDTPVSFSGKVQQKPLALLKALIAFGGKDVAEQQITDALWPDADGDLAHRSFEMAVHRLRKLIGHDGIIQLRERRLTLDTNACWVDAWAFEKVVESAEFGIRSEEGAEKGTIGKQQAEYKLELFEKSLSHYKGHFLPSDAAHPWALSFRERLRSRFYRLIMKLGACLEQAKQWESAAEVFQRGLEVDNRPEEFYQRLMVCHRQLGRRAEAMAVYDLCRSILSSTLGISPSPRTEELHQAIKDG